jgi:GntR family transcriptional regulator
MEYGTEHIDRTSPIPFYFQLAEALRAQVLSGRREPGARIPSEPEMCRQFNVSRSVVRQALATLESEGLIRRDRGLGTFVSDARARSWLLQSSEGFFQEEVDRMGLVVTSKVLRAEVTSLPGWASEALGLSVLAPGVALERLRFVNGQVALYVVNFLPEFVKDTVLGLNLESESLYEQLEAKEGLHVFGGRRVVESVSADERLADLLQVAPGSPLACIESVSWGGDLEPFDCYQAWLRTDRMRIEIQVLGVQPGRTPPSQSGRDDTV